MNFDKEIAKVENILKGKFAEPSDKQYWVDKLNELKRRKQTVIDNERYFKSYEKGIQSKRPWVSKYSN